MALTFIIFLWEQCCHFTYTSLFFGEGSLLLLQHQRQLGVNVGPESQHGYNTLFTVLNVVCDHVTCYDLSQTSPVFTSKGGAFHVSLDVQAEIIHNLKYKHIFIHAWT